VEKGPRSLPRAAKKTIDVHVALRAVFCVSTPSQRCSSSQLCFAWLIPGELTAPSRRALRYVASTCPLRISFREILPSLLFYRVNAFNQYSPCCSIGRKMSSLPTKILLLLLTFVEFPTLALAQCIVTVAGPLSIEGIARDGPANCQSVRGCWRTKRMVATCLSDVLGPHSAAHMAQRFHDHDPGSLEGQWAGT